MKGIVVKSTGSWYKVATEQNTILDCKVKGKLRLDDSRCTNPIAVGDVVMFDFETDTLGVITEIQNRKNYIIRKASNLSKQSQIIAANVDRAYIVVTIHSPQTLLSFIDRFLISAEAYSIPCTILINKCDLYTSPQDIAILEEWEHIYSLVGYETMRISTVSGLNIDKLREQLSLKTNVLSGNSGVGKSSLIHALDSTISLKTTAISKSHNKGQHTTTFAEMYSLSNGGYIIDTPGIKAFGLLDLENEEMGHYFPEIFAHSKDCQYNNCTHVHEPNCAVIKAVEELKIPLSRYENYVSFMEDDNKKHR